LKEQTRLLLEKARHTIHAAQILIRDGEPDSAASRAYYAMFYVASALLEERALRATKIRVFMRYSESILRNPGSSIPSFTGSYSIVSIVGSTLIMASKR
jgi:hypothetical protein